MTIVRWMPLIAALASGPALGTCKINSAGEFPITMQGTRPIVIAQLNGQRQPLLLDSGAFYSTMGSATAAALKIRPLDASGLRVEGVGGSFTAMAGYVQSLTFGRMKMAHVGFIIGGSDTGTAGLLGQDILHGFDVEYDLGHGIVRLWQLKDCSGQGLAYWAANGYAMIPIEPTTQYRPHTVGLVYVNGQRLRALFDTGASSSVLSLAAAARLGVRPGGAGVEEGGTSYGIGSRPVRSWIGHFDSFRIGQEEVRQVRLRFGDIGPDGADMLLGADFFLAHRMLVATSQNRLYFTYNGGPVFDLSKRTNGPAVAVDEADAPRSAADFARRGAARASRHDLPGGLADLDRAVQMAPDSAEYLAQRSALLHASGRPDRAIDDLNGALQRQPDNADWLMERARLRINKGQMAQARPDLDRVASTVPDQAGLRLRLGILYEAIDAFEPAIAQYTLWLKAHSTDNQKSQALNDRCWARTLSGQELAAAIADCNAALYLAPKSPEILDSRGAARMRSGDLVRAAADYRAALALDPKLAWSLYGQSLIERKQGDAARADADRVAALKLDASVEERAIRYGLHP